MERNKVKYDFVDLRKQVSQDLISAKKPKNASTFSNIKLVARTAPD